MQITVENLSVDRGGRRIIDDLSLTVGAGQALVLTGPNGAGKTTLLRALAGLLATAAGTIGLTGGPGERELAELCHFVGHGDGVKAALTVGENLRFWSAFLAEGDGAAKAAGLVEDALARFDLVELADIPARYLSAGQRRRLALARLLAAPRPVWLLDEPTVSLDAASVAALARIIDAHTAGGGIVFAATHLPLGLARSRTLELGIRAEAA